MNLLDCESNSVLWLVKIEMHQDYDCIMHWGIFAFIFWRDNKKWNTTAFKKNSAQNGSTLLTVQYYYLLYTSSALDNIQIILCNFNGWLHRAIAKLMHCEQCGKIISGSEFLFLCTGFFTRYISL